MKYVGSKQRIAKYIVPIIQNFIRDSETKVYIEPFVGGANIIDKVKANIKIGNDFDEDLIEFYQKTTQNPDLLNQLPKKLPKELYIQIRDNKDDYEKWYREAILLFGS